jgi:hypothetical protein
MPLISSPSLLSVARPALRLALPILLAALSGCASRPVPLQSGRTHLRSVSAANYGAEAVDRLERLLDQLSGRPNPGAPQTRSTELPEDAEESVDPPEATADGMEPGDEQLPAALPPVRLDVALMREAVDEAGRKVLVQVQDGAVLRDGFGRGEPGEGFKLRLTAVDECWVYVVHIDATARPRLLYPSREWSTQGNPLQAQRPYRLPEGNLLFELGQERGVETLYVLASAQPEPVLEALLEEVVAHQGVAAKGSLFVQRAALLQRGVAQVIASHAPAVVSTTGALSDVPSLLYVGTAARGPLVVTRWFRHE